jgi:small subunit ribosomal protein S1
MESEDLAASSPPAQETKPADEATMTSFLHTVDNYRILKRGEVVEGVVVRVNTGEILVDIGAKTEGIIHVAEGSDSPTSGLTAGDKLLVYVVIPENREGVSVLSLARAQAERDWRAAQQLNEEGSAFDGEVIGFNKGGLIVRFGEVRGFVPASQVVELRAGDRDQLETRLSKMIGRRLKLKVIEIDRARNRLILSEKSAHREWRAEMRDKLLEELSEGELRHGRVTSLCDFGAFVDLGGIDGLVHISELAWRSVGHPSEVLQVGNEVDVCVLGVDREKRRVALSIKRTKPEPWLEAVSQFSAGQLLTATVTKLVAFGAFARVAEGVEGLIHISELATERIGHPKQVLQVGDTVMVRVLSVDAARRRLSLSLRQARQLDEASGEAAPPHAEPTECAPGLTPDAQQSAEDQKHWGAAAAGEAAPRDAESAESAPGLTPDALQSTEDHKHLGAAAAGEAAPRDAESAESVPGLTPDAPLAAEDQKHLGAAAAGEAAQQDAQSAESVPESTPDGQPATPEKNGGEESVPHQ